MTEFVKKNKYLLLTLCLIFGAWIVFYMPYLLSGEPYFVNRDVAAQSYPFWLLNKTETINALKSGTLPFYSWLMFLGGDLWSSKAFYGMFNIYDIAGYLLPGHYYLVYDFLNIVKCLVAGLLSFLYFRELGHKDKNSCLGALVFALSSWFIHYTGQPAFSAFYSLLPLYFIAFERYLKKDKKCLFIIAVFLLLLTNYYLFFCVSAFSPLYFLYRYYCLKGSLKGWFKKALLLIGLYLIGVMLAGAVFVPTVLYMLQNKRVGSGEKGLLFKDITIYLNLIRSLFSPSEVFIYSNSVYASGDYNVSETCIFASSLVCLLLPQIIKDEDRKYSKASILLFTVLKLLYFIPLGGSIISGFSAYNTRWTMLAILMFIAVALRYLEEDRRIDKKLLLRTAVCESLVIVVCFVITLLIKGYVFKDYLKQFAVIIMTVLFIFINCLCLKKDRKKYLIVICVFELTLFGFLKINDDRKLSLTKDQVWSNAQVLEDERGEFREYLNSLDPVNINEFFRTYVPYESVYASMSHNQNIIYGFEGLMTYDSTYEPNFDRMLDITGDKLIGGLNWEFDIKDSDLLDLLAVKYAFVYDESEIPFNAYHIIGEYRGLKVVLNDGYRSSGRTYTKALSYEDLKNKYGNDLSLLNEYMVADDVTGAGNLLKNDDVSYLHDITYGRNFFAGEINCDDDSILLLSIPYNKGWTCKVNGNEVRTFKCNGGLLAVRVYKGNNIVELNFRSPGFNEGLALSIAGLICLVYVASFEIIKRKKK